MVQINLLPETVKGKQRTKPALKVDLRPLFFSLAVLMLVIILVWSVLGIQLSAKTKFLTRQDKQLLSARATLQKLDQLNQQKAEWLQKLEFLEQQLKREVLWAQNLNQMSNLLPAGIWLKEVVLQTAEEGQVQKYDKLDISGVAISLQDREMVDLIGQFMTNLKQDQVLAKQFADIQLISSQRSKAGKLEVMAFKLLCQFR